MWRLQAFTLECEEEQTRLVKPKQPKLTGKIDGVQQNHLFGWVADVHHLDRRLTVDVYSGRERIASAVANHFRQDLLEAGFGDGRHVFACELPEVFAPTTIEASVRVRGSDYFLGDAETFALKHDPVPFITYVASDIVNNCNLRCPFCVVDYSKVHNTQVMAEETFRRLLSLIYCVGDEGFWMSCLHEPTLHPKLNRFLEMIPAGARHKVWFTTNLTRPLDRSVFEAWAHSGLHHINVSLDTMNRELFAVLRKFGRYEVFKKNLDLMASVFRNAPAPPKVRYITMAFRSNLDEIREIVRYSNEHWLASENEIRYTFNVGHIADEFRRQHYLHKHEWQILSEKLAGLPYNYVVSYPPEPYEEIIQPVVDWESWKAGSSPPHHIFRPPLRLRARPDGSLAVDGHEHQFGVNVNALENPPEFFRMRRREAEKQEPVTVADRVREWYSKKFGT